MGGEQRIAERAVVVSTNHTHADSSGSISFTSSSDERFLHVRVHGWTTQPLFREAYSAVGAYLDSLGADSDSFRQIGLVDARTCNGASPRVVPMLASFLFNYGQVYSRIAIVASGIPLRITQVVIQATEASGMTSRQFHCCSTPEEALSWLEE